MSVRSHPAAPQGAAGPSPTPSPCLPRNGSEPEVPDGHGERLQGCSSFRYARPRNEWNVLRASLIFTVCRKWRLNHFEKFPVSAPLLSVGTSSVCRRDYCSLLNC